MPKFFSLALTFLKTSGGFVLPLNHLIDRFSAEK